MNLHHDRETIRAVDWVAVFPFLKLSKALREALQPARLTLGFLWFFSVLAGAFAWLRMGGGAMPNADVDLFAVWQGHGMSGVAGVVLDMCCASAVACAALGAPAVLLTFVFGGAISRLAALDAARGRWGRFRDASAFLRARLFSLVFAPVLMFIIPGGLFGLLVLAGRLWPASQAFGGLAMVMFGLFMAAGLVAAAVLLVGFAASVMLVPAMSVDGNDGFDAPGRAVSYLLARAGLVAVNLAFLAVLGVLAWFLATRARDCAISLLIAAWPADCQVSKSAANCQPWLFLLDMFGVAYAFSFFVTGLTRVYLIVRESADGVPETELWNPSDDKKVTMGVEEGAPPAQAESHE